jgi:hypothetical protein
MPKSVISLFLLALALGGCRKPTEEKITEVRNNLYKVDVRAQEFHNSGIQNVDVCVADAESQEFPNDKLQCFLHGFDFSGLSVSWRSERDVDISFTCGRVVSFRNFAVVSKGRTLPVEFHASLREECNRTTDGGISTERPR